MKTHPSLSMVLSFAFLAGCVIESEVELDGIDDDVIDASKADAFGFADGTYESYAMLQLVNNRSRYHLVSEVKLTASMADRIVSMRPFANLTALDKVPYTGMNFFRQLRDYVKNRALVGRCGDGISQSGVSAMEECDYAATDGTEIGCSLDCDYESAPGCGDGFVSSTEACDDGNLAPLDGCSAACQWELIDADVMNPTSTFKRFMKTARADLATNRIEDSPISIAVVFDLAQTTRFGVDVAAFHTLAWGNAPADFAAFKAEVAAHKGVETHPRLAGFEYVSATVSADPYGYVATPSVEEAANVSLLTPANSAWDTTIVLPVGRTYVTIQLSNWHYSQNSWAGLSVLLVPLGTAGPSCGDGVKTHAEMCDDGNRTSGDGCNATCSGLETYYEKASSTNMRASGAENAGAFRIISGAFVRPFNDTDVDTYKVTITQPTTVSLVHKIYDASPEVACTNFDGLVERVAADNSVLETSPDAADGCARLTLQPGTHILRVSEITPAVYNEPYLLQMQ